MNWLAQAAADAAMHDGPTAKAITKFVVLGLIGTVLILLRLGWARLFKPREPTQTANRPPTSRL